MDQQTLLKLAVKAAIKAGEEILKIYTTDDFFIETKPDHTPVTLADKESSKCILSILAESGLPVISEEEIISNYPVRKNWEYYWLVDPLDGTKEFIKRNGEFAVNIALIKNKIPVMGVIYGPFFKSLYFGRSDYGSYKISFDALPLSESESWFEDLLAGARKLPLQPLPKNYTVIASRSHLSRDINLHLDKLKNIYGVVDMINAGSAIKQCWVAEGLAHEYPRFGTTMEWDTAAGQCILEEAGKKLIDLSTNLPMRYNKESLENNFFIAQA